jgi:hypothetical protein
MAIGTDIIIPVEQEIVVMDILIHTLKTDYSNWKDWRNRFCYLYNLACNLKVADRITDEDFDKYEDLNDWIMNGNVEKHGSIISEIEGTYEPIWNGFPKELNKRREELLLDSKLSKEVFMEHMNYIVSLTGKYFDYVQSVFANFVADHLGLPDEVFDNLKRDEETGYYSLA